MANSPEQNDPTHNPGTAPAAPQSDPTEKLGRRPALDTLAEEAAIQRTGDAARSSQRNAYVPRPGEASRPHRDPDVEHAVPRD